MMRGYLDTAGGTTTVTVAVCPRTLPVTTCTCMPMGTMEAPPNGCVSDQRDGDHDHKRETDGCGDTNFRGTFTQANNSSGNYVLFTITATGFTITATPGASTNSFHELLSTPFRSFL